MTWFNEQMILLSMGKQADPKLGFFSGFIRAQQRAKRHARWMAETE